MQFPSFRSIFLFRRAQASEYMVSILICGAQIFQQIARQRKSTRYKIRTCKSYFFPFFSVSIKIRYDLVRYVERRVTNALLFRKTTRKSAKYGRPLYPCVPGEERAFNGVVNQSQSFTIARSTTPLVQLTPLFYIGHRLCESICELI